MANRWSSELRLFPTLRGYRRRWLGRDLLAGVTFGAVTIPGQIATAHLAGMPPITGLYGFLAACLIATILSANRHLAFGVDSTVAPMLAAGLAELGLVAQSQQYVGIAMVTTLLVGVMVLVVGIGNMGWVGDFLAKPVVIGFLGGIAVIIVVDQLPGLFGVPGGSGHSVARIIQFVGVVDQVNVPSLALGLVSLTLLVVLSKISPRFPGALLVLVLAISMVTVFNLTDAGVNVLGPLKKGLPDFSMPPVSVDSIELVVGTAVGIAIIALAQTAATTRTSAAIGGYETDINADFRALGAGNVLSSFFGAFTVDASPPSTTILAESRGRTQAASLVAAVIVIILLFASDLAQNLPTSTLAAVLVFIAIKIFNPRGMRATREYSAKAFSLMLMTLLGVVLFGIAYGVALAVFISFANRARRTARPELLRLERTADGQWLPSLDQRGKPVRGVVAYRLNGPLWFGNANWFRLEMLAAIPEGPDKPRLLVLDTTGMDDIDFSGTETLREIAEICELRGVVFAIVSHLDRTGRAFARHGFDEELGRDRFFDSVESAVSALAPYGRLVSDD